MKTKNIAYTKITVLDNKTKKYIINEMQNTEIDLANHALQLTTTSKQKINGIETRFSKISNESHTAIGITTERDYLKSTKIFHTYLGLFLTEGKKFSDQLKLIQEREENKFKRLIHNLRSQNAKIMQEVYYIALQENLIGRANNVLSYIENEVLNEPRATAKALLEILKCSSAQRAEFSAFDKIDGNVNLLTKQRHKIHQVVMNVFYLFFSDFSDKRVKCTVEKTELQGYFDYESIQVCLYHIVENSAKYTMPGSELLVHFKNNNNNYIEIIFEMISINIAQDEVQKIKDEGYSGLEARKQSLQGGGYGLTISEEMLKINHGLLTIIAGNNNTQSSGYARNKFIITLPIPHS